MAQKAKKLDCFWKCAKFKDQIENKGYRTRVLNKYLEMFYCNFFFFKTHFCFLGN